MLVRLQDAPSAPFNNVQNQILYKVYMWTVFWPLWIAWSPLNKLRGNREEALDRILSGWYNKVSTWNITVVLKVGDRILSCCRPRQGKRDSLKRGVRAYRHIYPGVQFQVLLTEVVFFTKPMDKAWVGLGVTMPALFPMPWLSDTCAGPNLMNDAHLRLHCKCGIRSLDSLKLRTAKNESIEVHIILFKPQEGYSTST